MMMVSFLLCFILSMASARTVKLVTNSTSNVYLESSATNNTIGYTFSLYQNVLSVMVNGTTTGSNYESSGDSKSASFVIMPNLILEYNGTTSANGTKSIYGFLDKANDNSDWGNGFSVRKHKSQALNSNATVDIWQINANWKNPSDEGKPKFNARMYVASDFTEFRSMRLNPDNVLVSYSILDYPFTLQNSTLAFDQYVLSQSSTGRVANYVDGENYFDPAIGYLVVNRTALVDGTKRRVSVGSLSNTSIDIIVGNSTNLNVTGYDKNNMLLSFADSNGASNVTFHQRLGINLTDCNCETRKNVASQNAAGSNGISKFWTLAFVALTSFAIAFPVILL